MSPDNPVGEKEWLGQERRAPSADERQLRASEERLRLATESAGMFTWEADIVAGTVLWSENAAEAIGCPAEALPTSMEQGAFFAEPAEQARLMSLFEEACRAGRELFQTEFSAPAEAGGQRRFQVYGRIFYSESGRPLRITGVTQEVTERHRREESLRQKEADQTFLVLLADSIGPLSDAVAIQQCVCELVGIHLKVDRVSYWEVDGDVAHVRAGYDAEGMPSVLGTYSLQAFGPYIIERLRQEEGLRIDDIEQEPRLSSQELDQYRTLGIRALAGVALVREGEIRATFGLNHRTPRAWADHELDLVREVARRTWDAVNRARAEIALRESEATLRAFYDNSPVCMGITEPHESDVLHLYDNPATCRFFGVEPGSTSGKYSLADLKGDPAVVAKWLEHYRKSKESNGPVQFEHEFQTPHGPRWLSVMISPIGPGPTGRTRFCYVAQDVTEQMMAEVVLRRQATIFENQNDGIIISDPQGRIIDWNPACERILGYSKAEVLGKSVAMFQPPEVADTLTPGILASMAEHGQWHGEIEFVRKDGSRGSCDTVVKLLMDEHGEVVGTIGVNRDITESKQAQLELSRSREALAEQKQMLETLLATTDVCIAVLEGPDLRIVLANAAYRKLRPGVDMDGKLYREIFPEAAAAGAEERMREVLRTGLPVEDYGYAAPIPGKPDAHWDHRVTPLDGLPSEGRRILVLTWDVTERERAYAAMRESESRFRTLADNISQLCWITDEHGWIHWYNKRWYEFTGTTFEEMQGWGWMKIHHPDHVEGVVERFKAAIDAGTPWEDIFPIRGADGEFRWFLSRALPIRNEDGKIIRWFGTNTDITDQRKLEAELREQDRRKDIFLATLAHELRNPLAPIRTSVELLKLRGKDEDILERARTTIERQVKQMVRLVDDLLDVSRITRDKLELRKESVELQSVLQQAVEHTKEMSERTGHSVLIHTPSEPIFLHADPVRLMQIFGNILTNSLKYTPVGGLIELHAARKDRWAEVTVTDTGIGISAQMLPRVFDLFTQDHAVAGRSEGGLGIGLSLVKRLVEMHGGSVEVHSDGLQKGTEVRVRLPIAQPNSAQPMPAEGGDAVGLDLEPRRILLVDDNEDGAHSLSHLLELSGHEVRAVHSGWDAITVAPSFKPDVILLDIGLPGLDGYETCKRLRQNPELASTLILALTGWGQDSDRERSRDAGFDHHFVKPIDLEELAACLRRHDDSAHLT
jgi:PAS domain S-box-containing protein